MTSLKFRCGCIVVGEIIKNELRLVEHLSTWCGGEKHDSANGKFSVDNVVGCSTDEQIH